MHLFHGAHDFPDAVTVTIPAIHGYGVAPGFQAPQGQDMRSGQVADVDVVPDAGAVRGRVVRTVNIQLPALSQGRFTGNLDQQGAIRRGLPDTALRIGARHVEIA